MIEANQLMARAEILLTRLERLLPPVPPPLDWQECIAARWRARGTDGWLEPVTRRSRTRLADLDCIEAQKAILEGNTRQFLAGLPANNCLLWGPRGTGKSSLVKALLNEYGAQGLRIVDIDRAHLTVLPEILDALDGRPQRFIVFCDDLSFEPGDAAYKTLKASLDGTVAATPDNVLVYATSNRRHLLPERLVENLEARNVDGEIHHGESVEEKVSLSERFGLWLSFHPFTQDQYLHIVERWLERLGAPVLEWSSVRAEALQWALQKGSRSGRSAWQFARDCTGRARVLETRG